MNRNHPDIMIGGVDIIFILPPVALVVAAILVGLWVRKRRGVKIALISGAGVICCGGVILFLLFILWVYIYYAGGGH